VAAAFISTSQAVCVTEPNVAATSISASQASDKLQLVKKSQSDRFMAFTSL
jgi:hypothetical protein